MIEEYHYFCAIRSWSEFSTPFLNLIWILKELKYEKSSKTYCLNALCFTISFFLCRYLSGWFYWNGIYEVHDSDDFISSAMSTKTILILPPIIPLLSRGLEALTTQAVSVVKCFVEWLCECKAYACERTVSWFYAVHLPQPLYAPI